MRFFGGDVVEEPSGSCFDERVEGDAELRCACAFLGASRR
jgi:hypothetical protein